MNTKFFETFTFTDHRERRLTWMVVGFDIKDMRYTLNCIKDTYDDAVGISLDDHCIHFPEDELHKWVITSSNNVVVELPISLPEDLFTL